MGVKLKIALMAALLIAMAPQAFSVSKIYDAFHPPGEGFTIENVPLRIVIEDDLSGIYFISQEIPETNTIFVKNQSCGFIATIKVCYNGTTGKVANNDIRARIIAYPYKPVIKITRVIGTKRPYMGTKTTVTVQINNTGNNVAENFEYSEQYPFYVTITNCNLCTIKGNSVTYSTTGLREGKGVKISYDIAFHRETPGTYVGIAKFHDGLENVEVASDKLVVEPQNFLEINLSLNKTSISAGEKNKFKIVIKNRINESVTIKNLKLNVPRGINVKRNGFPNKDFVFEEYLLGGNSTREITSTLEGGLRGSYELTLSLNPEYKKDGVLNKYEFEKRKSMIVEVKAPELLYTFGDSDVFESGQSKVIRMTLINYNKADLHNLNLTINSNLSKKLRKNLKFLIFNKSTSLVIVNENITMPLVNSTTVFNVATSLNYTTEYGENLKKDFLRKVVVKPIEGLVVKKSLSASSVESEQKIVVEVSVKNKKKTTARNVTVFEILPRGLNISGPVANKLSIDPEKELKFYVYTITAPVVANKTSLSFNTTAVYTDHILKRKKEFNLTKMITIEPKKLSISVSRKISDIPSTDFYQGRILRIDYEIENKDVELIKDLRLVLPLSHEFDLLGEREIRIKSLAPGEKIRLRDAEIIRPKYNRTLTLKPAVLYYKDKNNNKFNATDDPVDKSFLYGNLLGPAILINKTASASANLVTVNLTVRNAGSEPANVNVRDRDKTWMLSGLEPNSAVELSYEYIDKDEGKKELSEAYANYTYDNNFFSTVSNVVSVTVKAPEVSDETKITEENEKDNKGALIKKLLTPKEEPKGFFGKLLAFIRRVLLWRRE